MVTTDPLRRGLPTPKAQPSPIVTDEDERRMARIQIFYLNRQVIAYDNLAPTNPSAMRTRLRMRQQAIEQIMSLETILQHDRAESHRERRERSALPPPSASILTSTASRTAATPAGKTRASPSARTTATDRTALGRARRASPPPGDTWSFPEATAAKSRRAPSPPPHSYRLEAGTLDDDDLLTEDEEMTTANVKGSVIHVRVAHDRQMPGVV